jgi:hypothetical protein
MLLEMSRIMNPWWGISVPESATRVSALQYPRTFMKDAAPEGLPVLVSPLKLPSIDHPHSFGWINYWSERAVNATRADVDNPPRELFSVEMMDGGAAVVQLTEKPLNATVSADLDVLRAAYQWAPGVGRP